MGRKNSTYREEGGGGWVPALPRTRTSRFPLRLGFLTCTRGAHDPCLAPPKGLSVTRGQKSFAHCKEMRTRESPLQLRDRGPARLWGVETVRCWQ